MSQSNSAILRMACGSNDLRDTFTTYKNVKLELAVVSSIEALRFVAQYRDKILPDVPVVFYSLSSKELEGRGTGRATGRTVDAGFAQQSTWLYVFTRMRKPLRLSMVPHKEDETVKPKTAGERSN